jgi:hypothetical protein
MPAEQQLELFIEKQLLEDIEETGKPRNKIVLLDICNKSKSIYGEAGSNRRRLVQLRFDSLKRKSIVKWAAYLDAFKVDHGPETRCQLEQLNNPGSAPAPPAPAPPPASEEEGSY